MPVNKKQGETKEEFLPRCIKQMVNEGKDQDQSVAICYQYWEEFGLSVKELTIDLSEGIDKISLVESPAVEQSFLYFNSDKEKEKIKMAIINDEQQIITGLIMRPQKLIYRRNEKTGESFYVFFTEETVRQTAELYLKNYKQKDINEEHSKDVNDIYLFESWLVEDPKNDKADALGLEAIKGDWYGTMRVSNKDIWKKIKDGLLTGYSIEGTFLSTFNMVERQLNDCEKIQFLLSIVDKELSDEDKIKEMIKIFK